LARLRSNFNVHSALFRSEISATIHSGHLAILSNNGKKGPSLTSIAINLTNVSQLADGSRLKKKGSRNCSAKIDVGKKNARQGSPPGCKIQTLTTISRHSEKVLKSYAIVRKRFAKTKNIINRKGRNEK
jgi:hypothetical protein